MRQQLAALLALSAVCGMVAATVAQTPFCPTCPQQSQAGAPRCVDGVCRLPYQQTIVNATDSVIRVPCNTLGLSMVPLTPGDRDDINITEVEPTILDVSSADDRFARVIKATCRVTVSGTCGSGTVVGRDSAGNALVLTNAHVAGTQRGRIVQVQRWNPDGTSERGQGAIIAAGYGRGLSVDFALLKCNSEFAQTVTPIPLADRYPDETAGVSTYGCPRCEWPSMQVLKMTRNEGQVLRWQPEAIGGRSGSSLVDFTSAGPRVVGLLTWGGGGEGLGQSTPFLLGAMRGRLPKAFESLPVYANEVSTPDLSSVWKMPCRTDGTLLAFAGEGNETDGKTPDTTIDDILEQGPDEPATEDGLLRRPRDRDPDSPGGIITGPISRLSEWVRRVLVTLLIAAGAAAGGYIYGRMRS